MKRYALLILLAAFAAACNNEPNTAPRNPLADLPPYPDGITRISGDSLAFVLLAPCKQNVYLIGDFNEWDTSKAYKMTPKGERFWIKIGGLSPSREYVCQYIVDCDIHIADPFAEKLSDPNDHYIPAAIYPNLIPYPSGKANGVAMAVSTKPSNYQWQNPNFEPPPREQLIVYEILLRDFTTQKSIKAAKEKIPYLKNLGINAVELMPFNEFEGNESWGYNPSFYFAPDKAYGTPADYKDFIDECHANGIAVIMDMVLNHSYGQSPMVRLYWDGSRPLPANPWYNVQSPNTSYLWGFDFNHESPYTQAFVDSVCAFWMREYRVDGFRFDFTKGFTQRSGDGWARDPSRIAILKRMADQIWLRKTNAIVICEHLTDNAEEKELAAHGIMLWGNINYNINEATMGWGAENDNGKKKGDISWASYQQRGWTKPNLVAYMESHDEERIMFKNTKWGKDTAGYDVKDLNTALRRTEAAAVIFFALPGPKMLWQFGELGYDYELNNDRLAPKPPRWDYYDDPARLALHNVFKAMFDLRAQRAGLFGTEDYTISLVEQFKYIILRDGSTTAVVMANFDVQPVTKSVPFGAAGTWREHFTENTLEVSGADPVSITLEAGEYRVYFGQ